MYDVTYDFSGKEIRLYRKIMGMNTVALLFVFPIGRKMVDHGVCRDAIAALKGRNNYFLEDMRMLGYESHPGVAFHDIILLQGNQICAGITMNISFKRGDAEYKKVLKKLGFRHLRFPVQLCTQEVKS